MAVEAAFESMRSDTDLFILPETFSTGFPTGASEEEVKSLAEPDSGPTISFLKNLAAKYDTAIAGSFIALNENVLSNRAFFISPDSSPVFADKRHLFTMGGENKIFTSGNSRLSVEFRGWKIVLAVCYDLRFPVWCRQRKDLYDIMIFVANWPKSRISAWRKLIDARAIENLAYVAAVDCAGSDPVGIEYDGCSAVIDFKGKDISDNSQRKGLIYATLSKEKLESFRSKFPAHLDADPFEIKY